MGVNQRLHLIWSTPFLMQILNIFALFYILFSLLWGKKCENTKKYNCLGATLLFQSHSHFYSQRRKLITHNDESESLTTTKVNCSQRQTWMHVCMQTSMYVCYALDTSATMNHVLILTSKQRANTQQMSQLKLFKRRLYSVNNLLRTCQLLTKNTYNTL